MELTQQSDWLHKPFEGYVVNALFSNNNIRSIVELLHELDATFDKAIFCMPQKSLHITLMDWIAPLINYDGTDKKELYEKIKFQYSEALLEILSEFNKIDILFDEIRVSPSTIFIVGRDGGHFQKIRQCFVEKVDLIPGTKLPPQIIHSSIARFTKPIDIKLVESFISKKELKLTQVVSEFQLVHTHKEPMLAYDVLDKYLLK